MSILLLCNNIKAAQTRLESVGYVETQIIYYDIHHSGKPERTFIIIVQAPGACASLHQFLNMQCHHNRIAQEKDVCGGYASSWRHQYCVKYGYFFPFEPRAVAWIIDMLNKTQVLSWKSYARSSKPPANTTIPFVYLCNTYHSRNILVNHPHCLP